MHGQNIHWLFDFHCTFSGCVVNRSEMLDLLLCSWFYFFGEFVKIVNRFWRKLITPWFLEIPLSRNQVILSTFWCLLLSLLDSNAVQFSFISSGWRKISFFFNLSYEIKDKSIEFDDNRNVLRAEFVVRAYMQYVLWFLQLTSQINNLLVAVVLCF